MDQSNTSQNRKTRRSNVLMSASLELSGTSLPVKLRNLSAEGALVEGDKLPVEGAALLFRKGDLSVSGTIAWVKGRQAGVNFGQKLNPEQLLVAAASSCQLLSFLAVAAAAGIDIHSYEDRAIGTMDLSDSPARVGRIVLSPIIGVPAGTDREAVLHALETAHERCFIANSLSSEITIDATVTEAVVAR